MNSLKNRNLIIENRGLIARLASFLLPVILFIVTSRFGTEKFNDSFTRALHVEADKLREISTLLASQTSFIRTSAIREILANGLDPFYLLSLLLGGSYIVLLIGYLIKIGLSGYVMYLLLNKSICIDKMAAVIMSMIYALLPTSLLFGQITSFQNILILMPILALMQDKYLRDNSFKSFTLLSVVEAILFISGVYGFVSGIPFSLLVGLLLVLCRSERLKTFLSMLGGIILSVVLGAVLSTVVNIPRFFISEINTFEGEWNPNYKLYDFVVAMLDGKVPVTGFGTGVVPLTLGMFAVLLLVLLFVNPYIPFKIKVYAATVSVICHLTIAFPVLNLIANIFDGTSITASRFVLWAFILIFLSAISYKNLPTLSIGNIYLGVAILLGIVLISDLSVSEVSPTRFTLFFTTSAIIVIGYIINNIINKNASYRYIVCLVAFIEIFVNLQTVMPKALSGFQDVQDYNSGALNEEEAQFDLTEMNLDIFGDEYRYLLLSSDIADYQIQSAPDGVNALSTAALLSPVLAEVQTTQVYSNGIVGNENLFTIKDEGQQCELILKLLNPGDGEYYLCSGIVGKVYLTESDAQTDSLTVYEYPFFHEIQSTSEYVNLRIATTPTANQLAYISVWSVDPEARESLNSSTNSFDGNVIEGGEFRWMLSHNNSKSFITSIRYSPLIEVVVDGKKAETFSYLGYLAASLDLGSSGIMPDIVIRANTTDIIIGAVVSASGIATIIAMLYINKKIINNRNGREQTSDSPKD